MIPLRLGSILVGSAIVLAAGTAYWMRARRPSPEQREAARRHWLGATGRIIDGTVIDVREFEPQGRPVVQLLIYSYDVGGVGYECSQDITTLRDRVDLDSCRLGLPASVKYDPRNPGNSILVAENWSGLGQIAPGSRVTQPNSL